jgi:hypothetical protein
LTLLAALQDPVLFADANHPDDKGGSILGTIDIGGAPEQAVTDGHGKIYVDIEDKAAIAVIVRGSHLYQPRIPLSPPFWSTRSAAVIAVSVSQTSSLGLWIVLNPPEDRWISICLGTAFLFPFCFPMQQENKM